LLQTLNVTSRGSDERVHMTERESANAGGSWRLAGDDGQRWCLHTASRQSRPTLVSAHPATSERGNVGGSRPRDSQRPPRGGATGERFCISTKRRPAAPLS